MKVLTRGVREPYIQGLKDRGHSIIEGPELEVADVLNRIAGCNAVIMEVSELSCSEEAFYFGVASALAKDIVVITHGREGYWDEVPAISRFESFEEFFDSFEEGDL